MGNEVKLIPEAIRYGLRSFNHFDVGVALLGAIESVVSGIILIKIIMMVSDPILNLLVIIWLWWKFYIWVQITESDWIQNKCKGGKINGKSKHIVRKVNF